eukprot:1137234-Pelagomonas_calceolata.AAC.1
MAGYACSRLSFSPLTTTITKTISWKTHSQITGERGRPHITFNASDYPKKGPQLHPGKKGKEVRHPLCKTFLKENGLPY